MEGCETLNGGVRDTMSQSFGVDEIQRDAVTVNVWRKHSFNGGRQVLDSTALLQPSSLNCILSILSKETSLTMIILFGVESLSQAHPSSPFFFMLLLLLMIFYALFLFLSHGVLGAFDKKRGYIKL